MPISVTCSCGKVFRTPDTNAGKRGKCSHCGAIIVIPQPEPGLESIEEDAASESVESPDESEQESSAAYRMQDSPPPPQSIPDERRRPRQRRSSPDDRAKQIALERYKNILANKPSTNLLEYGYWALLLAFIPLVFSLMGQRNDDTEERLLRTLDKLTPTREEKAASKQKGTPREPRGAPSPVVEMEAPEIDLDKLIDRLPGGRIEGAFLPRKTFLHWVFALVAGAAFWSLTIVIFPGARPALHLIFIGAFTATIGIILLIVVQFLAEVTQGHILVSRSIIIMFLFWIAWAIGFSYRAAMDPTVGWAPSFFGYTFGVGFCEEVCKVLPILWHYRVKGPLPWRVACGWGFASGVGFGIAEGIMYSADFYNGIATGEVYLVRFISCVVLHGIWSASAALFIHKYQNIIQGDFTWFEYVPRTLFLVAISMVLHGLYDTFLKKDMDLLALLTALASFAWFVWSMERARASEESSNLAYA
jgi:RsiW-degrading membrane proteinase PrsW (M82 family)